MAMERRLRRRRQEARLRLRLLSDCACLERHHASAAPRLAHAAAAAPSELGELRRVVETLLAQLTTMQAEVAALSRQAAGTAWVSAPAIASAATAPPASSPTLRAAPGASRTASSPSASAPSPTALGTWIVKEREDRTLEGLLPTPGGTKAAADAHGEGLLLSPRHGGGLPASWPAVPHSCQPASRGSRVPTLALGRTAILGSAAAVSAASAIGPAAPGHDTAATVPCAACVGTGKSLFGPGGKCSDCGGVGLAPAASEAPPSSAAASVTPGHLLPGLPGLSAPSSGPAAATLPCPACVGTGRSVFGPCGKCSECGGRGS